MKSVRLLGLPVAGILMLVVGSQAGAAEMGDHSRPFAPAQSDDRGEDGRLVDLFMADDQTRLVDALAGLQDALETSEIALDDARLSVQERAIDAAGALLAKINAENAVAVARRVHEQAARVLAATEAERDTIAVQPSSQETRSELAFIGAEVAKLRQDLQLAAEDLYRAENRYEATRVRLANAETAIGKAERAEAVKRRQVASVERRIAAANGAFDSERAKVVKLVAELSPEQRDALQQSLGSFVKDRFVALNVGASQLKQIVDDAYSSAQIHYLAKALQVDAEFRQFAALTGNDNLRHKAEREKARYLAEIDRLEAEKYDDRLGGRSAFGVASHPDRRKAGGAE